MERRQTPRTAWLIGALALASASSSAALLLGPGSANAAGEAAVQVKVTGLESTDGQVMCSIFRGAEGFPSDHRHAVGRAQVRIEGSSVTIPFRGLEPGEYAVAVFHDANGNNKLDKGLFGAPTEGWGVSNNPSARLRAPRFSEASFTVTAKAPSRVNIRIKY